MLAVGKRDQRLELIAARFTFPQMPNPVSVQVLGPFRQEDRLPALGTMIDQSGLDVFPGARGSELHDASSAMLPPPAEASYRNCTTALKQKH
jgi:hypothetical protein